MPMGYLADRFNKKIMNSNSTKLQLGLALGSGSSRGWSHIGIINALSEYGIVPDIICGTSIGALVGASYVSNNIGQLEEWVRSLTKFKIARFFKINTSLTSFINTEKLHDFLNKYVADDQLVIENLTKKFAAVATDLENGREVWFTKGSIIEAVWASISLPALFPAFHHSNNRWLVDGGLVNPVPVSVCRALGADIVISVNLNGDILAKHFRKPNKQIKQNKGITDKFTDIIKEHSSFIFSIQKDKNHRPSLFDTIASSINITQDRITRSRMAGDPPDILLSPKLSHIGLLEFYRASECINEGRECVQRMLPEIAYMLEIT